jgi:mono/diheme cytochrome c family protein
MSRALKMLLAASAVCFGVGVAPPATAQQKITSGKAESQQIERGRYVVKISGCNDCHTANYGMTGGKIPESQWLMGDTLGWRGPWGTTYAVNLRVFMTSLTQDRWMSIAKSIQPRPPMPWWALHDMNQQDLKAMYAYVKWLGPAGSERRHGNAHRRQRRAPRAVQQFDRGRG